MACKRRRWRGPEFAAFFMRVACHQPWRSRKLPAVRLRPSVGRPIKSRHGKNAASGSRTYRAAGHDHTVYIRTRRSAFVPSAIDTGVNGFHASMTYPVRTIRNTQRRQRFTFEYDVSRPNHQKYTEASIVVHLKTKYPVRTVRYRHRRQSCTRKNEIARPNHQTYSEASIVVHLNMKYPVRTVRYVHRRQSCTRTHERTRPNRQIRTTASIVYTQE